jgi:hypothetical protein
MLGASSILPRSVYVRFPTLLCNSTRDFDNLPKYYWSSYTYPQSVAAFDKTTQTTGKTFNDTALAGTNTFAKNTPINQANLDALAQQIALDFQSFIGYSTCKTYNGVLNIQPNSLWDSIKFQYDEEDVKVKIESFAPNIYPEEMNHMDGFLVQENQCNPMMPSPCISYFGYPAECAGNGITFPTYRLCLEDGRLHSYLICNTLVFTTMTASTSASGGVISGGGGTIGGNQPPEPTPEPPTGGSGNPTGVPSGGTGIIPTNPV